MLDTTQNIIKTHYTVVNNHTFQFTIICQSIGITAACCLENLTQNSFWKHQDVHDKFRIIFDTAEELKEQDSKIIKIKAENF